MKPLSIINRGFLRSEKFHWITNRSVVQTAVCIIIKNWKIIFLIVAAKVFSLFHFFPFCCFCIFIKSFQMQQNIMVKSAFFIRGIPIKQKKLTNSNHLSMKKLINLAFTSIACQLWFAKLEIIKLNQYYQSLEPFLFKIQDTTQLLVVYLLVLRMSNTSNLFKGYQCIIGCASYILLHV